MVETLWEGSSLVRQGLVPPAELAGMLRNGGKSGLTDTKIAALKSKVIDLKRGNGSRAT